MRTLARNKQKLKYSLRQERVPIYELDENGNKIVDYVTEEGEEIYKETGSYTSRWSEPVIFYGNIAMSGGEAEAQEFGLSLADYDAVLLLMRNEVPLTEGALIWIKSEVTYKNEENTELDEKSADFTVLRVSESINFSKYILRAVVK